MNKKVLIVESPTKAKTINRFLGKGYLVYSSFGHIRDLPKTNLGVDVDNDFEPKYTISRKKAPVVRQLKQAVKNADVYLATDYDREGEAIAWHLAEILKLKEPKRITFHEITESAINKAVENPRKILEELVNAQKARRIIDRLFGYKLSPLLWKKLIRGLSAGRVQSAALRLIVEREREINAFKPETYFKIIAFFKEKAMEFSALLEEIDSKQLEKFYFKDENDVQKLIVNLKNKEFKIKELISRPKFMSAPAPFITSTLQRESFSRLRFSAKKTMFLAQRLYEGVDMGKDTKGLITYMRTDSPSLAKSAQSSIRKYILNNFGKDYLPDKPVFYKARKGAQEAHEAIRPTDFSLTPDKAKIYLEKDQLRLYELIFNRAVASQMRKAEFRENIIKLDVKALNFRDNSKKSHYGFVARGLKDVFMGFIRIYPVSFSLNLLPQLEKGDKLKVQKIEGQKLETKPKARYTEASLIKKLESLGIGRPSTYAPIIDVLYYRNYIERKVRLLFPTELGEKVIQFLETHFKDLIDYGFTAGMEKELDEIAKGKLAWIKVVRDFYNPFSADLAIKEKEIKKDKDFGAKKLDRKCPKCGANLVEKYGRFGKFISCENFPKCDYKEAIKKAPVDLEKGMDEKIKIKIDELKKQYSVCPECGGELALRKSRFGYFLGCKNYPKCRFIAPLNTKKKSKYQKPNNQPNSRF